MKHRINYFKKLVLFCICIGIVPVVTLGYFSYAKSSGLLLEKANRSNAELVEQARLRFEQKLKMADNAQTQFISSSAVNTAMDQQLDKEHYVLYEELIQSINRLQTYELGLTEVYLVSLNQNWVLDSSGRRTIAEHPLNGAIASYAGSGGASYWTSIKSSWLGEASPLLWNMALIKKIPLNTVQPDGLLIAMLPSAELNKMIPQRSEPGDFYVLDKDFRVIAASRGDEVGQSLAAEPFLEHIAASQEVAGQFTIEREREPYGITYRKSTYNGWTYMTKVHLSDITKESRAIGWVTMAICFSLLALILALSFQGSRTLYRPIRKLYDIALTSPDMPGGPARSDELYWIERKLNTLLGNEAQMTRQLKEFFVHKLLQGAVSVAEIDERAEARKLQAWQRSYIMSLRIDTLEGSRYNELDRDLLLFAINNIAGELIPESVRLHPVVSNEFQVTVVGVQTGDPEETKAELYRQAQRIQAAVKSYLSLPISVGVSAALGDLSDAPRGFREAKEALAYGIRLGNESILFYEDMHGQFVDSPAVFPQPLVGELLAEMKLLDEAKALAALREFMTAVSAKNISHHEFQLCLLRLLTELLRMHHELGGSLQELELSDKSPVTELLALKSAKEIESWLQTAVIRPMLVSMERRRDFQYAKISDQVLDLIHREYGTGLTLEACGARLNYHPEYVGRVFRKETGVAFGDYLARYRLQIAKRLLLETNMTITEISEHVMYNKPQNFIRYFRKLEGITPGQYREAWNDRRSSEEEDEANGSL